MTEPFALELHRRFTNGESAEQLSVELGIPLERIEIRLRAVALYLERQRDTKSESVFADTRRL
jgi:hypothetical protein